MKRLAPWRPLLAITVLVLLMHAVLWQGVSASMGLDPAGKAPAPTSVQVRTVPLPPMVAPPPAEPLPAPPAPRRARPKAAPVEAVVAQAEAPVVDAVTPPDAPASQASRADPAPAPDALTTDEVAMVSPAASAAPAASAVEAPAAPSVPTYPTRIPPATTLTYGLQRGLLSGSGDLQWLPGDGRYQARLDGSVAGFAVLTWTSEGTFDAAGIAPARFTDRRQRGTQAANFRRDTGKITFSGPSTEFPLLPGAQDRLSWMLQLPAIVDADPARFGPGTRISLFVAGARGDAEVWAFQVVGIEGVTLGDGSHMSALKLLREPRKLHDTHVDVWLDPKRHHLPVRARLSSTGSDALELLLQNTAPPQ